MVKRIGLSGSASAPRASGRARSQDEFLDAMRAPEPASARGKREVDVRVGARRDDVELRVEDVDAVHDPVEAGHRERR